MAINCEDAFEKWEESKHPGIHLDSEWQCWKDAWGCKDTVESIGMEVDIVSNRYRGMIDMGNFFYIYIPMTEEEISVSLVRITSPCWRLRSPKEG